MTQDNQSPLFQSAENAVVLKPGSHVIPPRPLRPGAVTQSDNYVEVAKQLLVDYINSKLEVTDSFQIDDSYVYVVWFSKTLGHWKALLSTSLPDRMYYELTHDGNVGETYIDAYLKVDNRKVQDD